MRGFQSEGRALSVTTSLADLGLRRFGALGLLVVPSL